MAALHVCVGCFEQVADAALRYMLRFWGQCRLQLFFGSSVTRMSGPSARTQRRLEQLTAHLSSGVHSTLVNMLRAAHTSVGI